MDEEGRERDNGYSFARVQFLSSQDASGWRKKKSEHVIYLVKSHVTRGEGYGHGITRLIFKIAIDRISCADTMLYLSGRAVDLKFR